MRKQVPFLILPLLLAGPALAQQYPAIGQTSGPAVGKNVTPSTVLQKMFERRSVFAENEELFMDASAVSAGTPGVPGKPGTQSGGAPQGREASKAVY